MIQTRRVTRVIKENTDSNNNLFSIITGDGWDFGLFFE